MAITVSEKFRGRRRDANSAEIVYLVEGTGGDKGTVDDADAFDAVQSSAPADWDGMPGANIDVRQELIQGTLWEVAAIYSASDSTVFAQASLEYEFTYQSSTEHIFQSLQTRGVYTASGSISTSTFGNCIKVKNQDGKIEVEGIDLPGAAPTSTFVYTPTTQSVAAGYEARVEEVMGHVSSVPFFNRAALTQRFVSCSGGVRFANGAVPKWYIRFGFQFSNNRSNFTAGGIQIPFKAGHDLMWSYEEGEFNSDLKAPLPKPKAIAVEQIFFESNLRAVLGIG